MPTQGPGMCSHSHIEAAGSLGGLLLLPEPGEAEAGGTDEPALGLSVAEWGCSSFLGKLSLIDLQMPCLSPDS